MSNLPILGHLVAGAITFVLFWAAVLSVKGSAAHRSRGRLFFLSPRDFSTLGSVTVRYGGQPVGNLNELEYVDGAIWANVFESWQVVKIAPATGCVLGVADLHGLYDRLSPDEKAKVDADGNFVLNGIAHDPASGQFILTGKYWPVLFTGRFAEK